MKEREREREWGGGGGEDKNSNKLYNKHTNALKQTDFLSTPPPPPPPLPVQHTPD